MDQHQQILFTKTYFTSIAKNIYTERPTWLMFKLTKIFLEYFDSEL